MANNQFDEMVAEFKIDPKTHPIYLQEFEWDIFNNVLLDRATSVLHRHKWVYRLDRPMGEVFIVGNNSMTATHLNSGRYCPSCKKVEFVSPSDCAKHTQEHWTQLDMIALDLK